ncbi:hypothetical protein OUY22_13920 [Nonomuraea sp. MCN248]|uniref:Uncharacterized protein n=1 Tax=Nonomuraea corallina TaxID=2989783 RepID=A0ABT4SBI1_9ACTN|nr:hypothetical protein [Nonomuraea corallina]MDA0634517.1 hypothetical protein [Nonomuraea corallina]
MEFVGLNPERVGLLIKQMESGKNVLGQTRPGLETDIADAGPDWAGGQGVTAMHRAWHFFHDAQRDLKWRIDTISRMHNGPSGNGQWLTAQFSFASEAAATQAGKDAAAAIMQPLSDPATADLPQTWQKVEAAMRAAKDKIHDPAFAAALISAIGPAGLDDLFRRWRDANAVGRKRGVPPEELKRGTSTFGVLANALANADTAGRLDDRSRKALVDAVELDALTALTALAKQSTTLLNQVAKRVLNTPRSGAPPDFSDADWNLQALINAYAANPEALQQLLAEDKTAAAALLHPNRVKLNGLPPEFEKQLAGVLDKALRPSTGDSGTRARAWFNLVNGLGYDGSHGTGGHFDALRNSPINQVLARNVLPYISQLGLVHAREASVNLDKHLTPQPPWDKLRPDVASRFIGAIMQDSAARKILLDELPKYGWGLDIGRFHPFSDRATERAEYTRLSARLGGVSSLLLGGLSYARLSRKEYAEWAASIALLPVSYAVNAWGDMADAAAATARDVGLDAAKEAVAERIAEFLAGDGPQDVKELAKLLVNQQVLIVAASLELHDQPLLTAEDRERIFREFYGSLADPLIKALDEYGG